ncbi:MAG: N-acetyl-gamma-glutamyl-phosphate reductase [Aquificae bacterium]|nr:N-acetyl-gamma-glutamyl-phosphate reductase [Aquificota bacterium]
MEQTLRVAVFGASGYTASELIRALINHPRLEITNLVSRSHAGKKLSEVFPHLLPSYISELRLVDEPTQDYELAFLCLPHEASHELVPLLLESGKRVVDLSGAYRISEEGAYEEFYRFSHKHPELLREAVYGLTELFREKIKGARLVANPGCYPTATLLGLYPFLKFGLGLYEVIVHALSGVSGAGRTPRQEFHFPEMSENFFSYSVEKHRHVPEMEDAIRRLTNRDIKIRFTPTVVPTSRGMLSTIYLKAPKVDVLELFRETYKDEIFVKVLERPPHTKWVLGTNYCFVYPYYDRRTETYVIISAIDNLGKGASLQAVQNANVMMGWEEDEGLFQTPLFP